MADQIPTLGELYKGKKVLEEEIMAAIDAYVADPTTGLFMIGEGYGVDLAAAVAANGWATERFNAKEATESHKRQAVRTALLLARPVLR